LSPCDKDTVRIFLDTGPGGRGCPSSGAGTRDFISDSPNLEAVIWNAAYHPAFVLPADRQGSPCSTHYDDPSREGATEEQLKAGGAVVAERRRRRRRRAHEAAAGGGHFPQPKSALGTDDEEEEALEMLVDFGGFTFDELMEEKQYLVDLQYAREAQEEASAAAASAAAASKLAPRKSTGMGKPASSSSSSAHNFFGVKQDEDYEDDEDDDEGLAAALASSSSIKVKSSSSSSSRKPELAFARVQGGLVSQHMTAEEEPNEDEEADLQRAMAASLADSRNNLPWRSSRLLQRPRPRNQGRFNDFEDEDAFLEDDSAPIPFCDSPRLATAAATIDLTMDSDEVDDEADRDIRLAIAASLHEDEDDYVYESEEEGEDEIADRSGEADGKDDDDQHQGDEGLAAALADSRASHAEEKATRSKSAAAAHTSAPSTRTNLVDMTAGSSSGSSSGDLFDAFLGPAKDITSGRPGVAIARIGNGALRHSNVAPNPHLLQH
jgi:hypothetical protein